MSLPANNRPSPLLNLPVELLNRILTAKTYPTDKKLPIAINVALVCKLLCDVVDSIIYRSVELHSNEEIALFHRTVMPRSARFLQNVKRLAVTCPIGSSLHSTSGARVRDILDVCHGLRSLTLPTNIALDRYPIEFSRLSINSFDASYQSANGPITHLDIVEPPSEWHSPTSILDLLGISLQTLTHLHLARRAHANIDNDAEFVNSLRTIIATSHALRMIVISVFTCFFDSPMRRDESDGPPMPSNIWTLLSELQRELEMKESMRAGTGLRLLVGNEKCCLHLKEGNNARSFVDPWRG